MEVTQFVIYSMILQTSISPGKTKIYILDSFFHLKSTYPLSNTCQVDMVISWKNIEYYQSIQNRSCINVRITWQKSSLNLALRVLNLIRSSFIEIIGALFFQNRHLSKKQIRVQVRLRRMNFQWGHNIQTTANLVKDQADHNGNSDRT